MLTNNIRLRRPGFIIALLAQLVFIASLVRAIINATHSDGDISEFVRKLLPAGNCLCESSTVFDCRLSREDGHWNTHMPETTNTGSSQGAWRFQHGRDDSDIGMSEDKCTAAFPGLFEEVYRAVGLRAEQQKKVSLADLDAITIERGRVRAMIINGTIRILEAKQPHDDHRKKALATLYSIHRAISTRPKAIPDIEFVFSIDDMVDCPSQPVWTLARRSQDQNLWLMPDFGFWAWDLDDIGTIDDVSEQIERDEEAAGWDSKIRKLVWRGKLQMLPMLRRALLDASRGKSWSDVAGLKPGATPENYIGAAEQCKYMFLAHAEGMYP